ncbi:MAG TPA: flagellar hook assembly protein FlgD [Desulfobacterales bacterium]|nr:flagellar hook assembly protein FlgD [Desulfobacterales bacterium]
MSIEALNTGYTTSSASNTNPSSNSGTDELGKDQFIKLFIAQIQYQDPLNPLDSAEFTAQLAQFSSVEQLYGMNSKLGNIEETMTNQSEQHDNLGYIGKTVKADDNTLRVDNGTVQSGSYTLDGGGYVTIDVYDSDGVIARTFYKGWEDKGEHDVNWDGRDDTGALAGDGSYTFEVTARDEDGFYVSSNTYISGEVTGITYQNGQPYLMIGDRIISDNNNIIEVTQTTAD